MMRACVLFLVTLCACAQVPGPRGPATGCPDDLEVLVGRAVTLVGEQTRTRQPTVCGVDVDGDYELSEVVVVARGVLESFEIKPFSPDEPLIATRGPGTYYRLVAESGRLAKTRRR